MSRVTGFKFFRKYPNVLVVCAGTFMSMIGFGMIFPFFPLYAEHFGATPSQIGMIASMFALTRTALATPFGALSDRYGRKRMMMAGFLSYSVAMSLFAFAQSVNHLFVLRGLQGVASAMVWPSAQAVIADSTEHADRGRAMAYFSASWTVSMIIGPAFGGFIAGFYGYEAPFLIAGGIMIPITGLIYLFVAETIKSRVSILTVKEPVARGLRLRFKEIRESRYFLTLSGLMVGTFITTFGLTLIEPLLSIYAQEKVNATLTEISLAFTVMGLSGFLVRVVGSGIPDRIGRKAPILFGNLWASLLTFPLSIVRTPWQMIGILGARSAGWGVSDPATQALLADVVDENKRGRIFGLFGSVGGVAMIAGPTVGGVIYELYGGEISFALCGALTLMASIVLFFMISEPSHEETAL